MRQPISPHRKKQIRTKPHPKQTVLDALDNIQMFVRGTSYETYIQKELEQIKNVMIGKQ